VGFHCRRRFVSFYLPLVLCESFLTFISSGGVGGNVIANRLSEDPRVNVLVLEAGQSSVFSVVSLLYLQ
jgi:hypothetical protein